MKINKTWQTINFYKGKSHIEVSINYSTKEYVLIHSNNVVFSNSANIQQSFDKIKCVNSALKFIKQELEL